MTKTLFVLGSMIDVNTAAVVGRLEDLGVQCVTLECLTPADMTPEPSFDPFRGTTASDVCIGLD